ncbi:unnamed protein product [Cyclocybe aegerita]|uniref:Uncharacterized protein n=1 Tax=Cyclocybe aegerita TaxID=1973307 RepID=A0A8S0WRZ8_CYCAE|nr:unnamed protein product [Cyclocybe aegerita]
MAQKVAKQPNMKNLTALATKRQKLTQQIIKFNEDTLKYMGEDAFESLTGALEWIEDFTGLDESDNEVEGLGISSGHGEYHPEDTCLPFPSRVEDTVRLQLSITRLAEKELDLCKAFANDCSQNIWVAVGNKSFHYKNHLQTQAQVAIQSVERNLKHHCRLYSQNLHNMELLGLARSQDSVYRRLTNEDLKASPSLVLPNIPGQPCQL